MIRSLLFCFALLLATTVGAALDDLKLFNQEKDTQKSMVWPMLPNENLAELATKFYPNNKAMQRKFITQTKKLNIDNQFVNNPTKRTDQLTAIILPNLESLSATAGPIRRAKKNAEDKDLHLSYNIKSTAEKAKEVLQHIPERLMREYEELVVKNTFLKEELEKLNKRLVFLQNKLGQLKLVLDRTLSLPAPATKEIKNLDKKNTPAPAKPQLKNQAEQPPVTNEPVKVSDWYDITNKFLWLAILGLILFIVLVSYWYKKYQERKYNRLVNAISQQNQVRTFSIDESNTGMEEDALMHSTTLNKDTQVEEQDSEGAVQEAKMLMAQNSPEEAIEHLKWTIKATPKASINVWLYLLEVLRKQNFKEDFKTYAYQMHQNFNVMTPQWEERAVPMVVAQSLEEFPYIIKFLTEKWPNEKIIPYLEKLINDNRNGERSGFSKPVIEDILLLIVVLKARQYLD